MPRRLFVTTALPYANGPFHIGHIMEYIQADIWVRFQRMQGNEVHFIGADDAHGAPIMLAAEKSGETPEQFIARIAAGRKRYLDGFHIAFDNWHSTHSPENTELSQDLYRKLEKAKLIYRKTIEQLYDPVKGMFLADRYIKGECPNCGAQDQYGDACENCSSVYAATRLKNPYSTLSGATPEPRSSEHFFFRLSDPKCRKFLRDWIAKPGRLQPQVANKAKEWLEGKDDKSLADWDISRDPPYFGIRIPGIPEEKYFYVWLDAPVGYIGTTERYCAESDRDFAAYWHAPSARILHFIGTDIIYFHCLFWPAMLMGSGYTLPSRIFVHGFLTVNGTRMSKSRGTFITAARYLESLDPQSLRFYYASKLRGHSTDLDLNLDDLTAKVNADLVNNIVNLASRIGPLVSKWLDGRIGEMDAEGRSVFDACAARLDEIRAAYEDRDFAGVIAIATSLSSAANRYLAEKKPWHLVKTDPEAARPVCALAANVVKMVLTVLQPVLPRMAADMEAYLNLPAQTWNDAARPLDAGHRLGTFTHWAERLDAAKVQAIVG